MISYVVPAKAGTHTPCHLVLSELLDASPVTTNAWGYGSRRSPGRRELARLQRNPAIDHQLDAGDVFRFVGREKKRRVGDVPGFPHVPHRHLRVARAPHRLDVALGITCRQPGGV